MTKFISKTLLVTLSLVLALTTTALGQRRNFQSQSQGQSQVSTNRGTQTDAATVFRSARDLITDGQWARAQEKFSDYISSYPNEKNLDAALYWLAYAQQKLAKYDDCRLTILRLMEKYPTSSWRDDARVLLAQVPGTYVLPARTYATTVRGAIAATPPADTTIVYAPADSLAPVAVAIPGQGIGYGTGVGGSAWSIDDLELTRIVIGSWATQVIEDPC